jgi:hypothetical protein
MAFGNTVSSADALLKNLYSDDEVENALFEDHPFFGMVPKDEKSVGRQFEFPVVIGAGMGRSASFTVAQTMAGLTGEIVRKFNVTLVSNHADATASSEIVMESQSNEGAFLQMVQLIGDDQLSNFGTDVAKSLFRNGSGSRGVISTATTIASSSLKLTNPLDILNFEVGMQLDVAAAEVSGSTRAYGSGAHGLYVSAVNYDTFTLTIATTPVPGGTPVNMNDATDGIPTIAHGDFIYCKGDRNSKISGVEAWIPYGGPSATTFFGVDRTVNPTRLAGRYLDGTAAYTIGAILEDAIAKVYTVGGKITHFFMTPRAFAEFSKELGSKAQLVDVSSTNAQIGYTGIKVAGGKGTVVCVPDPDCPSDRIYGVNMAKWQLRSIKKAVHIWELDGKVWLRAPSDSGMEIRFFSMAQLVCKSPRDNITIKITAPTTS